MKFRKELVGAAVNPLVLQILADASLHGYEIVKQVNALSNGEMKWREGAIYPVLHKMEQAGLIKGAWERGESGKKRRVYSITGDGRGALRKYKKEWETFAGVVGRILEVRHA